MLSTLRRSTTRLSVTLLLIVSLILFAAPIAAASDGPDKKPKDPARGAVTTEGASSTTPNAPLVLSASAERKTLNVSYALYDNAIAVEQPPVAASEREVVSGATVPQKKGNPPSGARSGSVVSTAPMSPGEKFNYFLSRSFLSFSPYALSILSGVISEATDNDHGRHMTAGDFMADSMTHAARFRISCDLEFLREVRSCNCLASRSAIPPLTGQKRRGSASALRGHARFCHSGRSLRL